MPSDYLSFVRIRIFALAYTTCLSIIVFAIVLFALPTAGKSHVPALAVIAIVSLIVAIAACAAILLPKTQCSSRRSCMGRRGKIHVGIEALCSIASLPLIVTSIALEAGLTARSVEQTRASHHPNGAALDPHAESTLSALLLIFSCSAALVALSYGSLITGLAIYTHQRTKRTDVWFADAAARRPPFVYPPYLCFLQSHEDHDTSETDMEGDRRSQGVRIEQLEINPTLQTLLHQLRSHDRTRHTLAPDCTCGEKLPWGPRNSDEYRAVGQIYSRVWAIVAEREAQERARALGGRQRSWSAPVPIVRLPTERERRRTVFLVAFDAARSEH